MVVKIGILGFGNLGQFLFESINSGKYEGLEVAFVWNRSVEKLRGVVPDVMILEELENVGDVSADIIIEVSHPLTLQTYSQQILSCADLFIGSPTAIADPETEASIKTHAKTYERRVFIGRGALFAADDIKAMSDSNTLKSLTITMTKHPSHLHVLGGLIELRDLALKENRKIVLYEGPVRGLCEFAPKNVNTMATASFAASCLGLDKVVGRLVADPAIGAFHQVFIEIEGPMQEDGRKFTCVIDRMNPATMGQVTGKQTYVGFMTSLKHACVGRSFYDAGKIHVV